MARSDSYVFLERVQDEGLQLTQALIDARASPLLHNWLGGLPRAGKNAVSVVVVVRV